MFDVALMRQAERLAELAVSRGQLVASAESCTGGLIAALCTSVSGSSAWFVAGLITYTPEAKQQILGVSSDTLLTHGVVSEPVAREMALGVLRHSPATMSVAVTGIAGPSGGDISHPVGTVWFSWARSKDDEAQLMQTSRYELPGERPEVRLRATAIAMDGLIQMLSKNE